VEIQLGNQRFWTAFVEDRTEGYAGFRLHRESSGRASVAGQLTYWDATGGFVFETFNGDVPVEIVQAVIAEAKEKIKLK
jgi:hypothetical protein